MAIPTLYDIDFGQLYKNHKRLAARPASSSQRWDHKAQDVVVGQLETAYTRALIGALDLDPSYTLLDLGCGSGAIAVQVASQVKEVYALDYSQGMLDKLQANAQHYNTHNIKLLCKNITSSWQDVPLCDVVIASRSTLVDDMEVLLLKMHAQAKRHVYLTYPLKNTFGAKTDIDARQHPELATPSYMYVLAILHQYGIAAQLRFIDASWVLIDWAV